MEKISVRRKWNDWRIAEVESSKLRKLHWDNYSGGVQAKAPQYFLHAYVWCNEIEGDIAHSCAHGEAPHYIKVCITKIDNNKSIFKTLLSEVGPKPKYYKV